MPRKINEEAFKWCLDYEWTGKGAAKVKEGHEIFYVSQDSHDLSRESLLDESELWLLQKYRYLKMIGFKYVQGDVKGSPWGDIWEQKGSQKGDKWVTSLNNLINKGYLQALHITSHHTTSVGVEQLDAPPKGTPSSRSIFNNNKNTKVRKKKNTYKEQNNSEHKESVKLDTPKEKTGIQILCDDYNKGFELVVGSKINVYKSGRDLKLMKELIEIHGIEDAQKIIRGGFNLKPEYVVKNGYTVHSIVCCKNQIITEHNEQEDLIKFLKIDRKSNGTEP